MSASMRKGVAAVVGAIALAGVSFAFGYWGIPDGDGRIEPIEGGLMAVGVAALTVVAAAAFACAVAAVFEWIERGDDS